MTERHQPGDRLVAFGKFRINLSLADRMRREGDLVTVPFRIGVRQYCEGLDLVQDEQRSRTGRRCRIDWHAVERLKGDTLDGSLAAFGTEGIIVIEQVERLVRACLDGLLELEVEVIHPALIKDLILIPRTPEAEAAARRLPDLYDHIGADDDEDDDDDEIEVDEPEEIGEGMEIRNGFRLRRRIGSPSGRPTRKLGRPPRKLTLLPSPSLIGQRAGTRREYTVPERVA